MAKQLLFVPTESIPTSTIVLFREVPNQFFRRPEDKLGQVYFYDRSRRSVHLVSSEARVLQQRWPYKFDNNRKVDVLPPRFIRECRLAAV